MPIHHTTIDTVKQQARIEEVIGRFVTLAPKGQNLWARCPFHNERTPSFVVSPARNSYKCFGCGKAGDAIQFLIDHENLDYPGAIRDLAQQYNIPIREEEGKADYSQAQQEKASLYILLELAAQYYAENLTVRVVGKEALAYCQTRHITGDMIQQFQLGYSTSDRKALLQFATKKGYQTDLLVKAGLVLTTPEGHAYARFRDRLIFPIHNLAGKIIAFGGRLLQATKGQPKYINSPETPLYQKGQTLYGLYQAKRAILKHKNAYLVEGYTDVLALRQQGIHNVVATAGTALTASHVQLLRRFAQTITLVFDADEAGQAAATKSIDLILAQGLVPQLVTLPKGEDPASYAHQVSPEALQTYLETHAQDFVTFKAQQCTTPDPAAKAAAIHGILQSIAHVADPIQRTTYLQACSTQFGISVDMLATTPAALITQKAGKRRLTFNRLPAEARTPLIDQFGKSIVACEKQLVMLLLKYGAQQLSNEQTLATYLLAEIQDIPIRDPHHQHVINLFADSQTVPEANTLIQTQPAPIRDLIINLTIEPYQISPLWAKRHNIHTPKAEDNLLQTTYQGVLRLKYRHLQQMTYQIQQLIAKAEDADKQMALLLTLLQLKDTIKSIAKELGTVVTQLVLPPVERATV